MKIYRFVLFAAAAAAAGACVQQPATMPEPEIAALQTTLQARLSDFAHAIAVKDPVAVANMFEEDGTWILPDASTFKGRANIEQEARVYFQNIESFITDRVVIDKFIAINSNEAVTFSHGDYTLLEGRKPAAKRVNPMADYWRKGADGVWRLSYDLNADGPAIAAAASISR